MHKKFTYHLGIDMVTPAWNFFLLDTEISWKDFLLIYLELCDNTVNLKPLFLLFSTSCGTL